LCLQQQFEFNGVYLDMDLHKQAKLSAKS